MVKLLYSQVRTGRSSVACERWQCMRGRDVRRPLEQRCLIDSLSTQDVLILWLLNDYGLGAISIRPAPLPRRLFLEAGREETYSFLR
jgi:hypothetical protein